MTSHKIAQALLDIQAVKLSPQKPFTWASGIESPIYCDNRQVISYPEIRKLVTQAFVQLIQEQFPQTQVIAGTATAGIPHAAWLADALNLPMIYVRSSSKSHGLKNTVEGKLESEQKVVLIEDLISTGGSSLKAAEQIQQAGGKLLGVAAIFSYGFAQAQQNFQQAQLAYFTLSNLPALLEVAQQTSQFSAQELEQVLTWSQNFQQ